MPIPKRTCQPIHLAFHQFFDFGESAVIGHKAHNGTVNAVAAIGSINTSFVFVPKAITIFVAFYKFVGFGVVLVALCLYVFFESFVYVMG
ncbi:Uncharacterised protein [Neisseria meningitidis]|nr:Uncharacterised protein [Neisseria meningitidis]